MELKQLIERNLLGYVATRTHTGTSLEKNNEGFFRNWFSQVEYFRDNPENCGLYPIEGDHLERSVPWALLRGSGRDTIVLIHHTDTVDTDDYGMNKDLAYQPYQLTEMYKSGRIQLDEKTKEELDSGKWLFGRGVADMKGGAAIHMALLEEYSKEKGFKGNLIFLGLPDEENLSAGMRAAANLLKELKERHQLDYKLMLNVEPHERNDDMTPTIYDGSVGKLMPIFYVRGKLAHVGQVFRGFNPVNLLSEIVRRTEINPDFIERVGNTSTPPPTWLYMKDRKEVYDVSLPVAAGGYMSILTLDRNPKEVFDQLEKICNQAFENVIADMNKSYKVYQESIGEEFKELGWKPNVKTYGQVYREAVRDSGHVFKKAYAETISEIKDAIIENKMTSADGAYRIIEKTLEYVNDLSPLVVVGLAPPYYPNVHNSMLPEKEETIKSCTEDLLQFARDKWNQDYRIQSYYTGISDLSYGMFEANRENIQYIEENMLLWEDIYYIPLETIREISMPVLNVGPWGKDFHKYSERVYMEDLFERTPEMIKRLIESLLQQ